MITFSANDYGTTTVHSIRESQDDSWGNLVNEFQNFLKARGYMFDIEFSFQDILETAHEEYMEEKYFSKTMDEVEEPVAKKVAVAPKVAVAKKAADF